METYMFTVLVAGDADVQMATDDLRSQVVALAKQHMTLEHVEIDLSGVTVLAPAGLLIGS